MHGRYDTGPLAGCNVPSRSSRHSIIYKVLSQSLSAYDEAVGIQMYLNACKMPVERDNKLPPRNLPLNSRLSSVANCCVVVMPFYKVSLYTLDNKWSNWFSPRQKRIYIIYSTDFHAINKKSVVSYEQMNGVFCEKSETT